MWNYSLTKQQAKKYATISVVSSFFFGFAIPLSEVFGRATEYSVAKFITTGLVLVGLVLFPLIILFILALKASIFKLNAQKAFWGGLVFYGATVILAVGGFVLDNLFFNTTDAGFVLLAVPLYGWPAAIVGYIIGGMIGRKK